MTLLISYAIVPLYLSLLYLKGTKLSIFSAKVVNFWFSGKRKTLPFLSGRFFSFVWKWATLNNAYLCTLFKSVKLFFLPDFMELRLPLLFVWSIDYTQTHKKYTKVYLLFLSTFFSPSVAGTASSHPVGISRLSGLRRYTGYLWKRNMSPEK